MRAAARQSQPATPSILVITNPNDRAVNNDLTAEIAQCWQNNGSGQIETYNFEAGLRLGHDLIDPDQVAQQVDTVYPILVELIHRRQPV